MKLNKQKTAKLAFKVEGPKQSKISKRNSCGICPRANSLEQDFEIEEYMAARET